MVRFSRWRITLAVLILTVLIFTPLVIYRVTHTTVTLDVGGQVRRLNTGADTVGDLLDEAHVLLDPKDIVHPDPSTQLRDGMTITVHKAVLVAVEADNSVYYVRTQQRNPIDILNEQAIEVESHDMLRVDGQTFTPEQVMAKTWNLPPDHIQLQRSMMLNLMDSGTTQVIYTTHLNVGSALDEAGVDLFLADAVTPAFSTPVENGMTVQIERSVPVMVEVDGHWLNTRSHGPTVGDALAAIGVAPIGQDYTVPDLETNIVTGMTIQVVRVTEKIQVEQQLIPFPTVYSPDYDLLRGEEVLLHNGVPGVREQSLLVRYEDGREVERTLIEEQMVQPPVSRRIALGFLPRNE
ncbi:MAG TPA: ubiquitin-like domain-containing protein [Aggregatilineaceae bacterium]|nr:ubiquitin-like domain-containing protein [Aggregatilineaceae bacterium]